MPKSKNLKLSRQVALLRIIFGVIWGVDAALKWQPAFLRGFVHDIMMAAAGQPTWLGWWFSFWMHPLMSHPYLFAVLTAVIESLLALALLLGVARRFTYAAGAVFALLVWGIGEGFGGPYAAGSSDIGAAVIYILVFAAFYEIDRVVVASWSLDAKLARRFTWWPKLAGGRSAR